MKAWRKLKGKKNIPTGKTTTTTTHGQVESNQLDKLLNHPTHNYSIAVISRSRLDPNHRGDRASAERIRQTQQGPGGCYETGCSGQRDTESRQKTID